jgi:hypothetical protein
MWASLVQVPDSGAAGVERGGVGGVRGAIGALMVPVVVLLGFTVVVGALALRLFRWDDDA